MIYPRQKGENMICIFGFLFPNEVQTNMDVYTTLKLTLRRHAYNHLTSYSCEFLPETYDQQILR
jgi:hypothetical protein